MRPTGNPATQTAVTDPLGKTAVYTIERDPKSRKPRLKQVGDDCPSCGPGSNVQRFYEDPLHPLKVTPGG